LVDKVTASALPSASAGNWKGPSAGAAPKNRKGPVSGP
jgi:hypothetical protein